MKTRRNHPKGELELLKPVARSPPEENRRSCALEASHTPDVLLRERFKRMKPPTTRPTTQRMRCVPRGSRAARPVRLDMSEVAEQGLYRFG